VLQCRDAHYTLCRVRLQYSVTIQVALSAITRHSRSKQNGGYVQQEKKHVKEEISQDNNVSPEGLLASCRAK
jgi:hypothetical protein